MHRHLGCDALFLPEQRNWNPGYQTLGSFFMGIQERKMIRRSVAPTQVSTTSQKCTDTSRSSAYITLR